MSDSWKLIPAEQMTLRSYRCGVAAGQCLRLKRDLAMHDHAGRPTGAVYPAGEVWRVLGGNPSEPDIVWLWKPNGDRHTWDNETLLDWFEIETE